MIQDCSSHMLLEETDIVNHDGLTCRVYRNRRAVQDFLNSIHSSSQLSFSSKIVNFSCVYILLIFDISAWRIE